VGKKSPTQLSLDYLNKLGYTCQIVEHWNSFARVRQDCFGFGDILAYHRNGTIALIQTSTASNFSARKKKILDSWHYLGWKAAGGIILLLCWGPKGLREEEL
jgi:hypothetical protein